MGTQFKILAVLAVSLVLVTQSCKHSVDDDLPVPGNNGSTDTTKVSQSDTCSPDTVYFQSEILPLIRSNCAMSGCHDAGSKQDGVELTNYDKIMQTGKIKPGDPSDSELYEVITESDPDKVMPPPPASLTAEQKNAIRIWILQGAKNNICVNKCDTSNVTFSGNVWPIINTTCGGCHGGGSPQGGVPIRNYTDLKVLVDNGHLISVLKRDGVRKPMPPGGPIEDCAMRQVQAWINDGAKDN